MKLIERLKRWWAPGKYDEDHGPSDGGGFALADEDYERAKPTTPLVHGRGQQADPRDI